MMEIEASQMLLSVYRQLIDSLSALDSLGEYAAAAHLTAAIDVIENRIGRQSGDRPADMEAHPIATIAHRMREGFGERAQAVARKQLSTASGQAFLAWAAIVNRLGR